MPQNRLPVITALVSFDKAVFIIVEKPNILTILSDQNEHTPHKASAQDFQSKGPAIPQTTDDMPPKASKEELKARAAELNQ